MESVSLTPLYKTHTARLRIWRRAVWVFELVGFGGSAMLPSPSSVWPSASHLPPPGGEGFSLRLSILLCS